VSLAIDVCNVTKKFRIKSINPHYHTLKSAVISFLRYRKLSSAQHKEFVALDNVSFTVRKGQTTGIIGANGSGKSTLLKLMAGILIPASGTIRTFGTVSPLIELGAGFHPEFTGRENIFLNAAILGFSKKKIKRELENIIEFSGLSEFIDQPVKTYSSGMYMRLGFSVAVNVDPDILLIDEILAVGDEAFARKCSSKIEEFKNSGKTIVIVSHSMDTIRKWCSEAVYMDKGKMAFWGDSEQAIQMYQETTRRNEMH
jgi:lipopolysaccharide transport system ATP-binding protein